MAALSIPTSSTLPILLLILLPLDGSSSYPEIFDRGIPRAIGSNHRVLVSSALATLVSSIPYSSNSPRSFSDTITVEGRRVFLRLWFFTSDCHATPDASNAMPGFMLISAFRELHDAVANSLFAWGYSYITAIDGRFGMEYATEESLDPGSIWPIIHPDPLGIDSFPYTCFPYGNMIQSGPKPRLYSKLLATQALLSPDRRYKLAMERNCEAVLYDGADRIWATPTRDKASGCFLLVQQDGNLVVDNDDVCLWATGTFVPGYKLVSSCLALQDDRNLVLYRSDEQIPVWASNTNV